MNQKIQDMGDYNGIESCESDDLRKWSYYGEDLQEHSWFTDNEMQKWYELGYFPENLQIRTIDDGKWFSLQEYVQICGGVSPFLGSVSVEYEQNRRPQQYVRNVTDLYEQHRQQQITPVPMNIPLHHHMGLPGYPAPTSGVTPSAATNGNGTTQHPYFVNGNTFAALHQHPMIFPPGMEQYDDNRIYQHDGYGNERENPSSSSVSETPDSERCLRMMEDLQVNLATFDKCCGTEDAPWISRTIDCGTDTPKFPSTGIDCGVQTSVIFIKPKDVSRLLKDLTGINYYVR